eukprot:366212-Chlamydomonas_euryale.AAC.46
MKITRSHPARGRSACTVDAPPPSPLSGQGHQTKEAPRTTTHRPSRILKRLRHIYGNPAPTTCSAGPPTSWHGSQAQGPTLGSRRRRFPRPFLKGPSHKACAPLAARVDTIHTVAPISFCAVADPISQDSQDCPTPRPSLQRRQAHSYRVYKTCS